MPDIPAPDPIAPVCPTCPTDKRQIIREIKTQMSAVLVGEGVFHDADARKHEHWGTPGGIKTYRCDCGYTWYAAFGKTLHPCWCGWGTNT